MHTRCDLGISRRAQAQPRREPPLQSIDKNDLLNGGVSLYPAQEGNPTFVCTLSPHHLPSGGRRVMRRAGQKQAVVGGARSGGVDFGPRRDRSRPRLPATHLWHGVLECGSRALGDFA